ncbi:MAG: hypothetical protein HY329_07225 [Chloroflexi bacterium]|nr:hypothetical protein [Chloroflexota bacterium]
MATLRVLCARGDAAVTWDREKLEVGDPEAEEAVREAERIFRDELAKGSSAFRVISDEPAERIDAFDRTAEQIIIVPRMAGG